MKKPNILYLHTHDCGRFISPYGYDMPTPNLMKFAKEGTVFRQAGPSKTSVTAAIEKGHETILLVEDEPAILALGARMLKKQGYQCALSGEHHISRELKTDLGYDRVLNLVANGTLPEMADEGVTPDLSTEEAADRFLHEKHDKPFFLSVGFTAPHRFGQDRRLFNKKAVYVSPDSDESKYSRALPIYPDNKVSRCETANFKAGVEIMDNQFGLVLNALERSGHKDNTLVILTTDHGPGMDGMKRGLTDWGIGVFLMMRGPEIPSGQILDGMVSHVDVFPSIAEYLEVEKPEWLQGSSFMPMIRGEQEEINDYIYAEQGYHGAAVPLRAIRSSRYKLIRSYEPRFGEQSGDRGPMSDFWDQYGYKERLTPEITLYDLLFDPMERCNQADNPAYQEVRNELLNQLNKFMKETDDPLLTGVLPPSPKMLADKSGGNV